MPRTRAAVELAPELDAPACDTAERSSNWLDDLEKLAASFTRETRARPAVGWLPAMLFLRLMEEHGRERLGALGEIAGERALASRLDRRLRDAADRYGIDGLRPRSEAGIGPGARRPARTDGMEVAARALLLKLSDASARELATLPLDALGQLYERSLACSAAGGARKTRGAFYTPTYLVDYVVERTLGRLLDEMDPARPVPVRVLDPACGAGAFLLGAYRRLLRWHLERRAAQGDQRLERASSAALCEDAIFGVDVDRAAVDVAKLSLLLACCEGERASGDWGEPTKGLVLPRLGCNLRSGHSLIDTDWLQFSNASRRRAAKHDTGVAAEVNRSKAARAELVQPFHWQREFPEIFAQGGFDVVIGNPPYLSFGGRHAVDISGELRRYYAAHYESGGWPTAHSLFLERSVKLLSRRFVSFVVPDQVGHLGGYRSAREIAQREANLVEVRYWGERVFRGVTTPALTIVLDKKRRDRPTDLVDRDGASRPAVFRPGEPWSVSPAAALLERISRRSFSLGKLVGDCGIRTTSSREQVVEWPGAQGNAVPVLEGKLVDRYGCRRPRVAVRLDTPHPLFVSSAERYRAASFVIRQTASYPIVGPREHALYFRNSLLALFSPSAGIDVRYLVALLNSRLLRFVYIETVREAHQRTFPQVKIRALQSLPLRKLDLASARDKRRHDDLVDLVTEALAVQKSRVSEDQTQVARTRASQRFDAIDRALDDVVYELYELSSEERDAVEQSLARTGA